MPVKFDYKAHMDEIRADFESAGKNVEKTEQSIVKRMAEVTADAVRRRLGRDTGRRSGHKHRTHMADDVEVGRAKKLDGDLTRVVRGGRETGTLWHLVEYGTVNNNRNAKHFIERSLEDVEEVTDKIFDEEIRRGLGVK